MADIGIRFGGVIAAAAARHGLDPRLLAAVAAQESGGPGTDSGRNVVGDGGHGHGVFQIDDRSWAFAKTPAAMDPARNADMAASILSRDLTASGGNVRQALTAYNSGSPTGIGTPTTWPDGRRLGYADSVLRHESSLGVVDADLVADRHENAASVNALHALGAAAVPASASSVASAAASVSDGVVVPPPLTIPSSVSQTAPPRSWASISGSSPSAPDAPGSAADAAIASMVDQGDGVFDAGDESDGG